MGSQNKINNLKATISAFKKLSYRVKDRKVKSIKSEIENQTIKADNIEEDGKINKDKSKK